jgi:putative flippase GtrA
MHHWFKFNVIGVAGFALQSVILFILTHSAHSLNYFAATAVAVELAVLNNFAWHQKWTWNDRPSRGLRQTLSRLAKFNLTTGLVSIGGNLLLMTILVGRLSLPILLANVLAVVACSLLNFVLADRFAFEL